MPSTDTYKYKCAQSDFLHIFSLVQSGWVGGVVLYLNISFIYTNIDVIYKIDMCVSAYKEISFCIKHNLTSRIYKFDIHICLHTAYMRRAAYTLKNKEN